MGLGLNDSPILEHHLIHIFWRFFHWWGPITHRCGIHDDQRGVHIFLVGQISAQLLIKGVSDLLSELFVARIYFQEISARNFWNHMERLVEIKICLFKVSTVENECFYNMVNAFLVKIFCLKGENIQNLPIHIRFTHSKLILHLFTLSWLVTNKWHLD